MPRTPASAMASNRAPTASIVFRRIFGQLSESIPSIAGKR